jgi:ADP-ribosylglycohydrolase
MLGAIVGDIIGSVREGRKCQFDNIGQIVATVKNTKVTTLDKPEKILHEGLTFTDDSVLTLATDHALRKSKSYSSHYANSYASFFDMNSEQNEFYHGPGIGYGVMFIEWAEDYLKNKGREAYGSYGNGSAMRMSPVPYYHKESLVDALNEAKISCECTHNHPEGIKGGQATCAAIWLAINGASTDDIKTFVEHNFHYDLNFDFDTLVEHYVFNPTCQKSVPQAIWAALEGPDFITVMRRCLAIGGDTDTICAIAGSIAEPLYGIPDEMAEVALKILERDGPFLFEQYNLGIEVNNSYQRYGKVAFGKPLKKNKPGWIARLFSLIGKNNDN